jgi:hypothetical protein
MNRFWSAATEEDMANDPLSWVRLWTGLHKVAKWSPYGPSEPLGIFVCYRNPPGRGIPSDRLKPLAFRATFIMEKRFANARLLSPPLRPLRYSDNPQKAK